jgi:putative nucleotidyltransferase with HDIG domain
MPTAEQFYTLIDQSIEIPTIPGIYWGLYEQLQHHDVDIPKVSELISRDPPLVAKILRVANSVYYGRNQRTTSLETAILTIGLRELSTIIATLTVGNAISRFKYHSFDRRILWKHSLMTGLVARYLVEKLRLNKVTDGNEFLAGLLHDIGHFIMLHYYPKEFLEVFAPDNPVGDLLPLERKFFGIDHAEIGGELAQKWNLSSPLISAIRFHHVCDAGGEFSMVTRAVRLADRVTSWENGDINAITPEQLASDYHFISFLLPDIPQSQQFAFHRSLENFPKDYLALLEYASAFDM